MESVCPKDPHPPKGDGKCLGVKWLMQRSITNSVGVSLICIYLAIVEQFYNHINKILSLQSICHKNIYHLSSPGVKYTYMYACMLVHVGHFLTKIKWC